MKKRIQKLQLDKVTLRALTEAQLAGAVAAGAHSHEKTKCCHKTDLSCVVTVC